MPEAVGASPCGTIHGVHSRTRPPVAEGGPSQAVRERRRISRLELPAQRV